MKRLIAAGILSVFLITAYIMSSSYIKNACQKTNKMLNECITAYKDNKNAKEKAENLRDFWDEKEKVLSFFANHETLDEIELAVELLTVYSTSDQKELFYESSSQVTTLIHQLKEDTIPGIHSIF